MGGSWWFIIALLALLISKHDGIHIVYIESEVIFEPQKIEGMMKKMEDDHRWL
jgi:hypothetical protein